jgi:hypothetical protein
MAPRLENNTVSNLYKNPFQSIIEAIKDDEKKKRPERVRVYTRNYSLLKLLIPLICGRDPRMDIELNH